MWGFEAIRGFVAEIRLNRNAGAVIWALHRVTGIALVVYLGMHLIVLGASLHGAGALGAALSAFHTPLFAILEGVVVVAVAFHMFNGLRVIAIDFAGLSRRQRGLSIAVFCSAILVTLWSGWVVVGRLLDQSWPN